MSRSLRASPPLTSSVPAFTAPTTVAELGLWIVSRQGAAEGQTVDVGLMPSVVRHHSVTVLGVT